MPGEPVVSFTFGRDDLLRTRFAISPLTELVAATYVVRLPTHFPEHRPWLRDVVPRVAGLDLDLLFAVNPLGRTVWPNFQAPPPLSPHPPIEGELDRVADTDPAVVRADAVPFPKEFRPTLSRSSMRPSPLSPAWSPRCDPSGRQR
jgi:Family of unknown function (DUF5937)